MTQPPYFNHGFTDEHMTWLCQYGTALANQPQYHYYTCGWTTSLGVCSSLVQGPHLAEHLRTHHGVGGPDKAKIKCCWVNCSTELKKESLMRHVNEKHLELRYPCPNCPEQFTRPYTMQNHVSNKHPGN